MAKPLHDDDIPKTLDAFNILLIERADDACYHRDMHQKATVRLVRSIQEELNNYFDDLCERLDE